jgi:hypothetical protein
MNFELHDIDELVKHYEEHGFAVLGGLEEITARFVPVLADRIGADGREMAMALDPEEPSAFGSEILERLARIPTPPDLAQQLLTSLAPVLSRLVGPLVHCSSTFHGQFKGSVQNATYEGGYSGDAREVYASYLLHQDFTGANLPTSPSAATLWVGMNTCPDWTLRLYPGSHRLGLLNSSWWNLDDSRLTELGEPIDVPASSGTAVIFNAMLLHGTSGPGPLQRVSCDIRFFPLCAFLPTRPQLLPSPNALHQRLSHEASAVLQAPLLEHRVYLGEDVEIPNAPRHSVLNWVNYIAQLVRGRPSEALHHLERFVNADLSHEALAAYQQKLHNKPMHEATLRATRECLRASEPDAPELARLDRLLERIAGAPGSAWTRDPALATD